LTFFGHTLSHTLLPGLVLAYVLQVAPPLGALVAAALTVALVAALVRRPEIGADSATGIVFIALFALGIALVGLLRVRSATVGEALMGNILGVGPGDLLLGAALVAVVLVLLGATYRGQVMATFDRTAARALGLPVGALDTLLLGLVAATVIVAVQAVGVILAVAILVTPASLALLWSRRLLHVMALAAAIAGASGIIGLYAAFYLPVAAGPLIVLVVSAAFFGGLAARMTSSKFKVQSSKSPPL
jgi:ABC-type Mn2+/Zn2+ transport system permease subunit